MNHDADSLLKQRGVRQRDLVPEQALTVCHALVIGIGAIGRQVALQLAAVGMPRMHLFDDDAVQVENLAPQGYWPEELKQAKATVTAALCRRINPNIEVTAIAERFKRSTPRSLPSGRQLVAFMCVDSIQTRKLIWEALSPHVAFLVDGRMSAEVIRVLTADNNNALVLRVGRQARSLVKSPRKHRNPLPTKK